MYKEKIKIFEDSVEKATFLSRPNRFIVNCLLNNNVVQAYLPNPGRLWELLFKGSTVYLVKNKQNNKLPFTLIGVEGEKNNPIMLHTHVSNKVVKRLIEDNLIKFFHNFHVIKEEIKRGTSRFDLLLKRGNEVIVMEVKSCTLFHENIAMFPDALTERGTRHLSELATLSHEKSAILFLVQSNKIDYFLPEFHIDFNFAKVLWGVKDKVMVKAIGVQWDENLFLEKKVKELIIPWYILENNLKDSGNYLLILHADKDSKIVIGELGEKNIKKGYYIYVGSAKKNLRQRIERHKRLRKKSFGI